MSQSLLILVGLLLGTVSSSPDQRNVTYCVHEKESCGSNFGCTECWPLMWFVNRSQTIPNDSTIIFLPGNHSLESDGQHMSLVNFFNKHNLRLKGSTVPNIHGSIPSSRLVCSGHTGFRFQFSSNIQIQGLSFEGCGVGLPEIISTLHIFKSTNISLSHIIITDSNGPSLTIVQVCRGFVSITNTLFKRCILPTCSYSDNVKIQFENCTAYNLKPTSLLFANSELSFGNGGPKLRGKGLFLKVHQPMVSITVANVKIANGSAIFGGNVDIHMFIFELNSSQIHFINSQITNGSAEHGGGMYIYLIPHSFYCNTSQLLNTASGSEISFINTTFKENNATVKNSSGGGFFVTHRGRIGSCLSSTNIVFERCTFTHNHAKTAVAMLISQLKIPNYLQHMEPQLTVTLNTCTFRENYLLDYDEQDNKDGIIDFYTTDSVIIKYSEFIHNNGTALLLIDSTVLFEGDIGFRNNLAPYGAAIRVCETSLIFLKNGTHVLFENNVASIAGGAIYAGEQCLEKTPRCFYQPISNSTIEHLKEEMSLTFVNNSAALAGDAIYGGSVDYCFTMIAPHSHYAPNIGDALFKAIFTFHPNSSSMVTSDAYGVCVCDPITGEPNCTMRELSLGNKFPGETFEVDVTAVGQTNGTVPAMLNVSTANSDSTIDIHKQNKLTKCQTISLTVFAKPGTNVTLKVFVMETNPAKENSNYYRIPKLTARVKMAPCPWVFQLNKKRSCDCNEIFNSTNTSILCDINTVSIRKPGLTWFSCSDYTEGNSSCQELEGSSHNRHGTGEWRTLTQSNISDQCEKGWGGRLCAHCETNYSLSLGFPTCVITEEHCSVWKLVLLLFAFLLAGVLLVCFLAIFNLTVAEGAFNGLVFFANCIHANQNSFFQMEHKSSTTSFFRVFIAWLNLDLGFQVCLYSGMTAYQKFWLECGFLLYLLLIGVVIVCLSHKFIWFTRLIGRNVVPVLSTVMLLAYPKLVRRSIKGLHCTRNSYWSTDKHIPLMWYEDETINCFTGKHIPMFIVSLIVFIVATLYVVSLLMIQCLQRGSGWCVLRWVNKLRPFFEANTGPCRDHYRFWPGLLHLIRSGVFLESTLFSTEKDKILNLTAICVFMFFLVLVFPHGVYKKWPLNLLEFWLFLCLGMTTVLLVIKENSPSREHYTNVSITIAAATFVLILLFQTYKRVQKTRKWKKFISWLQNKRNRRRPLNDDCAVTNEDAPLLGPQGCMPPVVNYIDIREPLLEDD